MSVAVLCFTTSCQSPGKDTLEVRVMGMGMVVVVVLHNFYNLKAGDPLIHSSED